MTFHKIFYDESSDGGGVAVKKELEIVQETNDGVEEMPEENDESVEETPVEEITPEPEGKPEGEAEEELYTTDWSKYADQFDGLSDDAKESPEKALQELLNMKKGLSDYKRLQTSDATLAQVEAALKLRGLIGGVDDLLKGNVSVPLTSEPGAQPGKMPGQIITSVDLVHEEIKQGRITSEYAEEWKARAAENDRLNYGRDKFMNEALMFIVENMQGVVTDNKGFKNFARDQEFDNFAKSYKGKVSLFDKDKIYEIMDKFSVTPAEAQNFLVMKDPGLMNQVFQNTKEKEKTKRIRFGVQRPGGRVATAGGRNLDDFIDKDGNVKEEKLRRSVPAYKERMKILDAIIEMAEKKK